MPDPIDAACPLCHGHCTQFLRTTNNGDAFICQDCCEAFYADDQDVDGKPNANGAGAQNGITIFKIVYSVLIITAMFVLIMVLFHLD